MKTASILLNEVAELLLRARVGALLDVEVRLPTPIVDERSERLLRVPKLF